MEKNVKGIAGLEHGTYTQYGAAERFLEYVGDNYKFCTDTKVWMQYDEETGLWSEITEEVMAHVLIDIGHWIAADAINLEGSDRQNAAMDFAGKFFTKYFCSNVLYFCKGIKEKDDKDENGNVVVKNNKIVIPCLFDDFDANPEILGMANGKAYDLVNGKVIDGCREFMLTKRINGNVKDEISDKFLTFIHTMFPDVEVCDYVQKFLGSSLLGFRLRNPDDKNALFIDSTVPDTGKSSLLTLLENALGEYYEVADSSVLTTRRKDSNAASPALAALRGCRFVGISECPPGLTFEADDTFKQLTGNDTISVRDLFGRQFKYKPNFKLMLVSNHLPRPKNVDDTAFRKRFRRYSSDHGLSYQDETVMKKVFTQDFLDDFVTWLIDGCRKYQEAGRLDNYRGKDIMNSDLPEKMKKDMANYFQESDDLGDFFTTYYKVTGNDHDFVPWRVMWELWTEHSGERIGQTVFAKMCKDGFVKRYKLTIKKARFDYTDKKKGETYRMMGWGVAGVATYSAADTVENAKIRKSGRIVPVPSVTAS